MALIQIFGLCDICVQLIQQVDIPGSGCLHECKDDVPAFDKQKQSRLRVLATGYRVGLKN